MMNYWDKSDKSTLLNMCNLFTRFTKKVTKVQKRAAKKKKKQANLAHNNIQSINVQKLAQICLTFKVINMTKYQNLTDNKRPQATSNWKKLKVRYNLNKSVVALNQSKKGQPKSCKEKKKTQ